MDLSIFSNCLNCGRMRLLFTYLGITIGGNHRTVEFWNPVIHKIQSRLSMWKERLLSMAERICLIKSILNALPQFDFSFFKAPKQVCKVIRSIQIRFLWVGVLRGGKYHG